MTKDSFVSTYQTVFGGSAENADKVFLKLDKDSSGDVTAEELFELFSKLDPEGKIDRRDIICNFMQMGKGRLNICTRFVGRHCVA